MLPGYAQRAYGRKSLMIFEELQKEMDNTTFIGVILPVPMQDCNEGQYFDMVANNFYISPTMEIYSFMVDLCRRAGLLDLAMALINGCRFLLVQLYDILNSNVEFGKLAAKNLISLQPHDSTTYVLVTVNWEESKSTKLMDVEQLKKKLDVAGLRLRTKHNHSSSLMFHIYA